MIHQTLSGPLVKDAGIISDEDVRVINSLHNPPPAPVAQKDVYVRRCRLAGDVVDAYHGCFRTADLPKLLAMIQGAPLLVGHDKRSLGVARFFGGAVEEQTVVGQKHNYIVPKFYWLRGHSSADDLRVAIDGGLYNEASISFAYLKPACSVCGEDIRTCDHIPGAPAPDGQGTIFYYYDDVVAVLEGSLVYRGAEPGTGFSLSRSSKMADLKDPIHLPGRDPEAGLPALRIKQDGQWYRAELVGEQ